MKVIENGKWNNPWSGELSCSNDCCGAKLLVEEGDVKPTDDKPNCYYFVCPVCETEVDIAAVGLPPRLKKIVDKPRRYYFSDW